MKEKILHFLHSLDGSAVATIIGIILLFSGAVTVTLIAPQYIDPTWTSPASQYQVQMYEVADPHFYISSAGTGGQQLQFVHHLKQGFSLLAFQESDSVKIEAPPELSHYVTHLGEKPLKLTHRLLMLRVKSDRTLELFNPSQKEAFAVGSSDGIIQDWVDSDFKLLEEPQEPYQKNHGLIYISNPIEFRVTHFRERGMAQWKYDAKGEAVTSLVQLQEPPLAFISRKSLIEQGEHIYAIEGCWYCHTDQTRTLIQDLVLNGSDSFPAPPSSPNEYVYQRITFPGTKRNGPDLSRVGVKRPSRDWHKSHFWSPTSANRGSIMPAFRHFFDFDPRGTSTLLPGVPNVKFEAIFQYLMTKGTRITAPTEAWWLGLDPLKTKEIIEGRKILP